VSGSKTSEKLVDNMTARLRARGLDLVQAFDVARYNGLVADHESLVPLAQFGRPGALALLVGNTKALWPHFTGAFRVSADLQACDDPLDVWVESVVGECLGDISHECAVHFSHDTGGDLISMLHVAEVSGLATRGPAHLGVHGVHGPWFGLRAVIVVDAEPLGGLVSEPPSPCKGCAEPCTGALEIALETSGADAIASAWQAWVNVRDVCPLGKASRYSEGQIRYHYTKDRRAL
jgi:methylmalonic aciduria homocystinuria type C protein